MSKITEPHHSDNFPRYYHATFAKLDGKPLFARGSLPTVHNSLTYALWYLDWVNRLQKNQAQSSLYLYELVGADRYLLPLGDGSYSVSEIDTIPYDDRMPGTLSQAPELFQKKWQWGGKLTYIPAHCLTQVSAQTIRQQIDHKEWLDLCSSLDPQYLLRGMFSPFNLAAS